MTIAHHGPPTTAADRRRLAQGGLAWALGLGLGLTGPASSFAQTPAPGPIPVQGPAGAPGRLIVPGTAPAPAAAAAVPLPGQPRVMATGPGQATIVVAPPGIATVGPEAPEVGLQPGPDGALPGGHTLMAPDVQVVRFQGPAGAVVEVLGPSSEPAPLGDGQGLGTFGLRVGTAYQLRVTNLPERPGVELFPTIEVVGHLHRPATIDAGKHPIRVQLTDDDIEDVLEHGRMVTHVIYLEDPEQALPLHLPKGEVPMTTISPAEDPLKVAAALGRPMAILRLGTRQPTPEDLTGAPIWALQRVPCPFVGETGGACGLPCGPVACDLPAAPAGPPGRPRDEYLCDGGDFKDPAGLNGATGLSGVNPRDAVMRFTAGRRARVLPTNVVCLYAPRFGTVRAPIGANVAQNVEVLAANERLERLNMGVMRQGPKRFTENLRPDAFRHRSRVSELDAKVRTTSYAEVRVLAGVDEVLQLKGHVLLQGPELKSDVLRLKLQQRNVPPLVIKTAESAVVTGIVTGANQTVSSWKPQETVGVEESKKPGMAVVKQVDRAEAEPGDEVTFTIRFRNIGNTPITSVSVVDSLIPRFEYVEGSAQGPKGTVFTAAPNNAGSTELRWDLPGELSAGAEGFVSFRAKVR